MKKLMFILILFLGSLVYAQNYQVDYYGSNYAGNSNLAILAGDNVSGAYYPRGQIIYLQVDSNWTASNIGFMVYNPKENTWGLLEEDGVPVEYIIEVNKTTAIVPKHMAGLQHRIKFVKITNGSYITQLTNTTSIIVHTILY